MDPCIFIVEKFICIVYVADLIFWAKGKSDMRDLIIKLHDLGVDLEQEEYSVGFLGVDLERDEETGLIKMKQPGLIDCLISAVGLDDNMAKVKYTPTGSVTLFKNDDGVPDNGSFEYSSVICILLCLSGHTHIYITFAINCCSI